MEKKKKKKKKSFRNDISAVCHLQLKLSHQQSHQHHKFCLHSVGYLGLGQSLNAKCGLADASTSSEIRNESNSKQYSTPKPQRTYSDHSGSTLIKTAASTASRIEKHFFANTEKVSLKV